MIYREHERRFFFTERTTPALVVYIARHSGERVRVPPENPRGVLRAATHLVRYCLVLGLGLGLGLGLLRVLGLGLGLGLG